MHCAWPAYLSNPDSGHGDNILMGDKKSHKYSWKVFFGVACLLVALMVWAGENASAQIGQEPLQTVSQITSDETCLDCHQQPDMILPLPNGEELYLTVDEAKYKSSVHGKENISCTQCHTAITEFPHPALRAESLHQVRLEKTDLCIECHQDQAEEYAKGRHAQASIAGSQDTAMCVDCHSSHQTEHITDPNLQIAQTCEKCHSEIYAIYINSVHGAALIEEGNTDVPTCTSCHESHDNTGPSDSGYLLFSPQICASCHADEDLMAPYKINTQVFDTYLADFHGSTVLIFENISPDQDTNKPVCVDCHGVHDILSPVDVNSTVFKKNLITTCQRCHPDASPDFSDAWLSHYPPDLEHTPIIYWIDLFYQILIPSTIGGMMIFIASDVWQRMKNGKNSNGKRIS